MESLSPRSLVLGGSVIVALGSGTNYVRTQPVRTPGSASSKCHLVGILWSETLVFSTLAAQCDGYYLPCSIH
jgi:hypothetical protein